MTLWKFAAKVTGTALLLFAVNGLINYTLMMPLPGGSAELNLLRSHLDDAGFVLLFAFVAVVFWAMFAVLPRERGYGYLGIISLLTSIQLFLDWDGKSLLFGPFPDIPYISLAVKSGSAFLSFFFVAYLLGTGHRPVTRTLLWAGGALWAAVAGALLLSVDMPVFVFLNRLFLGYVFVNMALCIGQFVSLMRRERQRAELQRIAAGFILFAVVLLPDPAKDLLEQLAGHRLGYLHSFWEQCVEDTYSWALLSLLAGFGTVFFRRFVQTLKDNQAATEEIRAKNEALELEVDTRQRLDQLLSAMLRSYRAADWEACVIREGRRFFQPHCFALVKHDEDTDSLVFEGADFAPQEADIRGMLRSRRSGPSPGEALHSPSIVMGAAGGAEGIRLYLAVYAADGGPIAMEERDRFALLLMSKYVSFFYEYFQLLESRLKEIEQRTADRAPWLSKLFMQMAEKERKRLASDLHDEVLQELLHIRRMVDRTPAGEWRQADKEQIRIGLDNAEFMIRETCRELMPSFLSDQGVVHAVAKLVERVRLRADFQLDYHPLPMTDALSDEQTTAVYRIVQELVTNAMKHSRASRVTLELGEEDGSLHIRYADDGIGMETGVDFSATNRFGLRGIAERIHMIGGQITVQSQAGQGVKVHCSVPL